MQCTPLSVSSASSASFLPFSRVNTASGLGDALIRRLVRLGAVDHISEAHCETLVLQGTAQPGAFLRSPNSHLVIGALKTVTLPRQTLITGLSCDHCPARSMGNLR